MDEIEVLAREVERGTNQTGFRCPFCNGGRTGERSLSIGRRPDGTILFVCHRATCGRHGRIESSGYAVCSLASKPEFEPRVYQHATRLLSREESDCLGALFGLGHSDIKRHQICISEDASRLVIPVLGPYGQRRGVEARRFGVNTNGPKTLHYKEVNEAWLGWFSCPLGAVAPLAVIVEDVISAMKVSRQFTAISLMGSSITLDDMFEISRYGGDNLILCLDRDATDKALKYKQKFMYIAPQMRVVPLQRDLKYENDSIIRELLND